ncbi:hypothetical protein CTRI78_v004241 [Colletotrichum trifolii]|uniref:Fungal N-terminal domain-containing protein n=1 Tax=Colletotrichum trifolii TaxID=5466 RepID=A0A4R8RHE9_COLTR|nr:hypothetical protein CTRI78_v004241 [Colletotrichum trifolii]
METVFGVIGLTGQVIDTSLKIKNLIEKFKSAEEEFSNLQLKLTFVAKTCAYIQDAIEHDDREESGLLWEHGTVILTEIGKTLEKLKGLFPKEDASAKKRGKNRQGLYFLRKNDDIESFGKRLDDYLRILQMMITAETK